MLSLKTSIKAIFRYIIYRESLITNLIFILCVFDLNSNHEPILLLDEIRFLFINAVHEYLKLI